MGELILGSQPAAEGVARRSLIERFRPTATSFGPALLILTAQQVFFPMSLGLVMRGAVLGALTALIALGMAMVYRANRIINFAQADLGFAPAVVSFLLIKESGAPYPVALGAGLLTAIAFGAIIERFVIRRFFRAPRLLVTIATIGLSQVLAGLALLLPRAWGVDLAIGKIDAPFGGTHSIGAINFDANDLLVLIIAPVVVTVVALFLQRSDVGVAIRASADSADRASLLGVPVYRLQTVVWTVAAALAFLTIFLRAGVQGMPALQGALGLPVLLRALVALMLGRMIHLPAVTSAAVALGIFEQGVFSNHGEGLVIPSLAVIVAITLVVRRAEIGRGDATEDKAWRAAEEVRPVPQSLLRLPTVRVTRLLLFALLGVVVIGLPHVMAIDQTFRAATLMIYALLGLSLVLLSGWGGIVSLGHIAYFALGAAFGGWLMNEQGYDLLVTLILAACMGAAISTVVGIPTLRLRGMYLAVSSFAFALAASTYLLDRDRFDWVPVSNELIKRPPLMGGLEVTSEIGSYYLVLVVLCVMILAVRNIRASRFGRALVALRDNDRAAQAYAVSPVRIRLSAFALSGAIASLAGALFTFEQRTYDAGQFGPLDNLAIFTMVVIGGMTSATGAVLGALFYWGTKWFLDDQWAIIAQGAGVIIVLLLFPSGLAGMLFKVRDRLLRVVARRKQLDVPGYTRIVAADKATAILDTPKAAAAPAHLGSSPAPSDRAPVPPPAHLAPPGSPASSNPAAAGAEGDLVLHAEGVEVAYGGVPILFGVDLAVRRGEAVALLGTNGAGKSTLLRAISGLVDPKAGSIHFDGHDITGRAPHRVAAQGLLQMPGGQGVFPTLSVADNLRVASWLHRRDKAAVVAGVERVEGLFPVLKARADERASNLSGGQQQMLALGMALLGRPKLLMIDELSLGLAPSVVGQLMEFVDHLRDEGTTILVVEQSVNVALAIADRAVFLERGEVRFSGPAQELLNRPDLLRSVFLSSASVISAEAAELAHPEGPAPLPATPTNGSPARDPEAPPLLETIGLTVAFGGIRAVDDVSLAIAPGEIVGVIGPNGAGKTTLFDLISGFVPPSGGRLLLHGRDVTRLRAAARARKGLGRSFQDARLFTSLTVEQAIAVAVERWVQVGDPLSAAFHLPNSYDSELAVRRRVGELIELLGLQPYQSLFVGELSTGTRRVVDLACLLAHRPSVVLLDEPASGIAQREVEALAPLIRRIRDEMGASVVLVEHDIPLVEEVADRMVAMDRGRVLAVGTPAEVLADPAVVSSYLGDNTAAVNRSDRAGTGFGSERESVRATEQ